MRAMHSQLLRHSMACCVGPRRESKVQIQGDNQRLDGWMDGFVGRYMCWGDGFSSMLWHVARRIWSARVWTLTIPPHIYIHALNNVR